MRRLLVNDDPRGNIWIWEQPKPGAQYVIGGDIALARTATGKVAPDGDSCTAFVGERLPLRAGLVQVAEFSMVLAPFVFGEFLAALGKKYNMALINPERNLIESVRAGLQSANYPESCFFVESRTLSISGRSEPVFFTQTTAGTKKHMVDVTIDYLQRGKLILRSKPLLEELGTINKNERNIPELHSKDRSVALLMAVLADSLSPAVDPPEEAKPKKTQAPYGVDPEFWRARNGIPEPGTNEEFYDEAPDWDDDIASRL